MLHASYGPNAVVQSQATGDVVCLPGIARNWYVRHRHLVA